MALNVVESDAAQADGRALPLSPPQPSCQLDDIVHAHWIPACRVIAIRALEMTEGR